jgi:hypothetical protein
MSFRCTACFDKSYDKAWKLQRHIRESRKCSEQLNPGISRTRFKCWSCDYTSSREDDLRRHRRRIHPDTTVTTDTETEEAEQSMLDSHETSDVASCLQPATSHDTSEHLSEDERWLVPKSSAAIIKRKSVALDIPSPDHKRVCTKSVLIDLDALSLVDDSGAPDDWARNTTENNMDPLLFVSGAPTSRITALRYSWKIQSTSSSSTGTPQSVSVSCSSLGSLFGRPSKRDPELWMTWSSTSPALASLKSLHSLGMPAPMLESVDEELLLSRAGNHQHEPPNTYDQAVVGFDKVRLGDLNAMYRNEMIPCHFHIIGCGITSIGPERWREHDRGCVWITHRSSEQSSDQRLLHMYNQLDFLSRMTSGT